MRIISTCLIVAIAIILISPEVAKADEIQGSNEIKINLKIQEVGAINSGVLLGNSNNILLAYDPNNFKNTLSVKRIDPEREITLSRFNSSHSASLPQGKFTINASAYTAAADECGKSDGVTASGLKVRENETLACPAQFPFGTKIQIEGMGTYVCEDRGGAIKANHIDIYMETKAEAFSFGRQHLQAEVIS